MTLDRLLLPSDAGGDTTTEVGFFACATDPLARWLADGLDGAPLRSARWTTLRDATAALASRSPHVLRALVPVAGWSLLLTSGPHGTDVGVIPSQAARDLRIRAVRAVASESGPYAARILEVYGPEGTSSPAHVRSIAAVDDGGRWVFETSGTPLPFERPDEYARPRKADRLTSSYLYELLAGLGVPYDAPPEWQNAVLVG